VVEIWIHMANYLPYVYHIINSSLYQQP
jgi:hypothetical protein